MLSFLPSPLLVILNLVLISINTVVLSIPIFIFALLRPLLRFKAAQLALERGNNFIYHAWTGINTLIMRLTNRIEFEVSGMEQVKISGSCVIVSNHISWADIVLIGRLFGHRIPITKFFLKHSLIYIPVIGLVCLGLGMPFLRRYSRAELLKNPKLKGKDIESTRKACKRLIYAPTSLVNFAEGTRFTPQKRAAVNSPYRHLMPPKAASLAIALGQIGKRIDCILNLTLAYPENPHKPFIALLKGRMKKVYAHVEVISGADIKCGDYLNDKQFKHEFTLWLRDLWQQKDERLSSEVYHDAPAVLAAPQPAATAQSGKEEHEKLQEQAVRPQNPENDSAKPAAATPDPATETKA